MSDACAPRLGCARGLHRSYSVGTLITDWVNRLDRRVIHTALGYPMPRWAWDANDALRRLLRWQRWSAQMNCFNPLLLPCLACARVACPFCCLHRKSAAKRDELGNIATAPTSTTWFGLSHGSPTAKGLASSGSLLGLVFLNWPWSFDSDLPGVIVICAKADRLAELKGCALGWLENADLANTSAAKSDDGVWSCHACPSQTTDVPGVLRCARHV